LVMTHSDFGRRRKRGEEQTRGEGAAETLSLGICVYSVALFPQSQTFSERADMEERKGKFREG
jgi:hypothetical protein